nr:atherin-like [Aegilops tauschii subsp. strangulata]
MAEARAAHACACRAHGPVCCCLPQLIAGARASPLALVPVPRPPACFAPPRWPRRRPVRCFRDCCSPPPPPTVPTIAPPPRDAQAAPRVTAAHAHGLPSHPARTPTTAGTLRPPRARLAASPAPATSTWLLPAAARSPASARPRSDAAVAAPRRPSLLPLAAPPPPRACRWPRRRPRPAASPDPWCRACPVLASTGTRPIASARYGLWATDTWGPALVFLKR